MKLLKIQSGLEGLCLCNKVIVVASLLLAIGFVGAVFAGIWWLGFDEYKPAGFGWRVLICAFVFFTFILTMEWWNDRKLNKNSRKSKTS